ncbi:hypothetical protein VaNZ11_017057, partial [Volvox africanus]
DLTGYTVAELRASGCEYLRSFLDFGSATVALQQPEGEGEDAATNDLGVVLDVHTGSCGAALAASALHFLTRGSGAAPLEVDGANAAELLSLADLWCLDKLKAHVLGSLRRNMCNGFRRPISGTVAVEAVPQVAALLKNGLDFGIADADGGLKRLYDDCRIWLAKWAARAWPTRTFANLQRAIQDDVLEAAKGLVDLDTAPAVLSTCRQLSGVPAVAWARRIQEMRNELTSYTMSYIWSNFLEVCARAGLRRCRSECWGALLEELRIHVAENPDPDAAVRVLPRWAGITKALIYGAAPAAITAALSREAGGGAGTGFGAPWEGGSLTAAMVAAAMPGSSWLGGDEASQMQDLYELVRSYCVRHLSLVARCAAFRALSPAEQQSILLIAQEGICAGLATGAIDDATSLLQPGAAAAADGGGTRGSAAWVISLVSDPAASPPRTTSRPGRQRVMRAGTGNSRQPPQLQSVASAPSAVSAAPVPPAPSAPLALRVAPVAPAATLSPVPSAVASPQLRTVERGAGRSTFLRQTTENSSSNPKAVAVAVGAEQTLDRQSVAVQPLRSRSPSGIAVDSGAMGSRSASLTVKSSPPLPGPSQRRLSEEARPRSRRSSLVSAKRAAGSDGGFGSFAASIDAAPLTGLLVRDAGLESPAATATVTIAASAATAGAGADDSSIHVQRDAELDETAAVQTATPATLAIMEGKVETVGNCCGFGAGAGKETGAAVQLQAAGLKVEVDVVSASTPEGVNTEVEVKDNWQPAAVATAWIGTRVEVGKGGAEGGAEKSMAARRDMGPELEVYGGESRLLFTGGFQEPTPLRIWEDGAEADTSAKVGDDAPEASMPSGTIPARDGAAAPEGAVAGRRSMRSWIGARTDDASSRLPLVPLPLVPLPLVPLPTGAGVLKPFAATEVDLDGCSTDVVGDGGAASQPPTPAQREAVGLLGGGIDRCSGTGRCGSGERVEPSTTHYPGTCSTDDSFVNHHQDILNLPDVGSNSVVTAAASLLAATAGNAPVADDTRQPQAGASGAAVGAAAAADTVATSATS